MNWSIILCPIDRRFRWIIIITAWFYSKVFRRKSFTKFPDSDSSFWNCSNKFKLCFHRDMILKLGLEYRSKFEVHNNDCHSCCIKLFTWPNAWGCAKICSGACLDFCFLWALFELCEIGNFQIKRERFFIIQWQLLRIKLHQEQHESDLGFSTGFS